MKRVVALFLLAVFIVLNSVGVLAHETEEITAKDEITVMVKGEVFCFGESKPIIKNGRILVPLQCGIFEKFSAITEYDHIYKEIVIKTDTYVLTLYTDQLFIYNKGELCYEPDVSPEYRNGQAYVPLRAFMEAMGRTVEYDGETNTAKIS